MLSSSSSNGLGINPLNSPVDTFGFFINFLKKESGCANSRNSRFVLFISSDPFFHNLVIFPQYTIRVLMIKGIPQITVLGTHNS